MHTPQTTAATATATPPPTPPPPPPPTTKEKGESYALEASCGVLFRSTCRRRQSSELLLQLSEKLRPEHGIHSSLAN
jgi:hypothetical protein